MLGVSRRDRRSDAGSVLALGCAMRIGSLFSGIGGLELGLEMAGVGHTVWQVEIDPFCRKVLAKHWPDVERFEDVQTCENLPEVDIVCGGFPCQDVSSAGKRAGIDGPKSGLWREFARIVGQCKPRFVIVENVASGKPRWLPKVRQDLHLLGYGSTAVALSAFDVGAKHLRKRIFVIANTYSYCEHARPVHAEMAKPSKAFADTNSTKLRVESRWLIWPDWYQAPGSGIAGGRFAKPGMVRMVPGLPRGVDGRRRRALGNAVVPQCAEVIGRMLLEVA